MYQYNYVIVYLICLQHGSHPDMMPRGGSSWRRPVTHGEVDAMDDDDDNEGNK